MKHSRRRTIRYGLLAANVLLLVAVVAFVSQKPTTSATNALLSQSDSATASNPLDQLSSADIAVHISRLVQMDQDEVRQAEQNADSENAQLAITPADNVVVAKPQLVSTDVKSAKDIKTYVVVAGDTVDSLAVKFGVTSDSIKWSNGLTSNILQLGKSLVIPPVNGIVYTVKSGDTADSIAARYTANKDALINDNDADVRPLAVGQQILIRDGVQPVTRTVTPRTTRTTVIGFGIWNGGANTYVRGYCTWYAAGKAGVPGGWGNARTWHLRAPSSGWTVSTVPRVGAVAQTTAGWAGHVGIVEAVSADGSMIKYSDMNGLAGFNRVGYSDWVSTHGTFQRFIYR